MYTHPSTAWSKIATGKVGFASAGSSGIRSGGTAATGGVLGPRAGSLTGSVTSAYPTPAARTNIAPIASRSRIDSRVAASPWATRSDTAGEAGPTTAEVRLTWGTTAGA